MKKPRVYYFCHLKMSKKQSNSIIFFCLFSRPEALHSSDPTRLVSTHHTCEILGMSSINTIAGTDRLLLWGQRDLVELQLPLPIQKQPLQPLMLRIQYYRSNLEISVVIIKVSGVNRRFYSSALSYSKLFMGNNRYLSCEENT